ncbi:type II toxin-antitoxin system RelE/ParE family toxin [bacterium]|nr:type II toxin-antitoxin system RelE/ParE family toxin [bacterium]
MDKYHVRLYPRAFRDIENIYRYIMSEKLSPENAKKQTDRIIAAIESLEIFPESHQERLEGRFIGKGYRQLLIDNYLAIYKIDDKNKIVYIITVQYQGQNS